ncbi:MAG: glutaredoxin family protein [Halioglobus sp.]
MRPDYTVKSTPSSDAPAAHRLQRRFTFVFLAGLLLVSGHAPAQIYKWVDSAGNTHFGDAKHTPESAKSKEIELGNINTITSVTYDTVMNSEDKVVMYSASWCGYCKRARNYFRTHGIPFTEYDIEKSQTAAARYKELGASGVPIILYGNKRMNGFSEAGFARIYKEDT